MTNQVNTNKFKNYKYAFYNDGTTFGNFFNIVSKFNILGRDNDRTVASFLVQDTPRCYAEKCYVLFTKSLKRFFILEDEKEARELVAKFNKQKKEQ